jgi:hypothetical protein
VFVYDASFLLNAPDATDGHRAAQSLYVYSFAVMGDLVYCQAPKCRVEGQRPLPHAMEVM